ncbi:MAG: nucleotidyl transferase AbiEii/AbiGii toxin family protein [Kiritimatiellae bacterium]|nr:nucleotidyl transferase AbiEii/AbiGii toxin family protein [Kiritimatiellia bacterium]
MKRTPNSKVNLDKAILRFANMIPETANRLRAVMANAIVAQMIGEGVVKGGSGLLFRFGDKATRHTIDLDTAWRSNLDSFLVSLENRLAAGWNGFSGTVFVKRQAEPKGIPFDYVMQPCEVKLAYRGSPWYTVNLEIGHNEIGDADESDLVNIPPALSQLFDFLCLPAPMPVPMMRLEYQIAQKLHGCSAPGSKRAHDLVDLQIIVSNATIDMAKTAEVCRRLFTYRKTHQWPPQIVKGEKWDEAYSNQRLDLQVLPTADEAILWANELIAKIEKST